MRARRAANQQRQLSLEQRRAHLTRRRHLVAATVSLGTIAAENLLDVSRVQGVTTLRPVAG